MSDRYTFIQLDSGQSISHRDTNIIQALAQGGFCRPNNQLDFSDFEEVKKEVRNTSHDAPLGFWIRYEEIDKEFKVTGYYEEVTKKIVPFPKVMIIKSFNDNNFPRTHSLVSGSKQKSTSNRLGPALKKNKNSVNPLRDEQNLKDAILKNQGWLLERMIAAGYESNINGVCAGLEGMARQAILANDMASFNQRLFEINSLDLNFFKSLKEKNYKNHKEVAILAFFDGVELYQQARKHPELFEKNKAPKSQKEFDKMTALIHPVSHPTINNVGQITGAYNQFELANLFNYMEESFKNDKAVIDPIAFKINCENHTLSLGYFPENQEFPWTMLDANFLPGKRYRNGSSLALDMLEAFAVKSKDPILININCYSTHTNLPSLELLFQQQKWKELHAFSQEKYNLVDRLGDTLVHLASIEDDEGFFKSLSQDADINKKNTKGATALHLAVIRNNKTLVDLLLNKGAKIDVVDNDGNTILHYIPRDGVELLKKLLDRNPALIETKNKHDETALDVAKLLKLEEVATVTEELVAKKIFLAEHDKLFKKDKSIYGFFSSTKVNKDWDIYKIIEHAKKHNNRSREVCVKLKWMEKDGTLTTQAPNVVKREFAKDALGAIFRK